MTPERVKVGDRLDIPGVYLHYSGAHQQGYLIIHVGKIGGKEILLKAEAVPDSLDAYWADINLLEEIGIPYRLHVPRATAEEMEYVVTPQFEPDER